MTPTTYSDIRDLMAGHISSAALSAAFELRLFWRLAQQPQTAQKVAQELNIPLNRCCCWLELLAGLNLLERQGDAYTISSTTRSAILDVYSAETWWLLAQEAREQIPVIGDLPVNIGLPGSLWAAQGLAKPDYVAQMAESPERARRFTRMLYEIHRPLADEFAKRMDVQGVRRLMDLGGGSGVMSLALLERYPDLTATVVDISNVCIAGREIAAENRMSDRITYHSSDFLHDELPGGFDMALECDVGIHDERLFRKVWGALNAGGRMVIVDELLQPGDTPNPSRIRSALYGSLDDPGHTMPTSSNVQSLLIKAGFRLDPGKVALGGMTVIQARK